MTNQQPIILTQEEIETHTRLMTDYQFFARYIQMIEPKDITLQPDEMALIEAVTDEDSLAGMIPLIFNPIQTAFHLFIEDMWKRRGLIRCAMGKPRQFGGSTYIQGRAHWRACKTPGMKVHIVSHNDDSTKNFLVRARKMCAAAPPTVTPGRPVENSKKLVFANGASYSIATAGNPDAIRSDNCHFLHASEEAYWKDGQAVIGAVIPALSDALGSEGYRESTSKGKGNAWHKFIQETKSGQNEWELFFEPWFKHPKYQAAPPPGWEPDHESLEAQQQFKLSINQVFWRAMKVKTLGALWLFKQEFPAFMEESFQASANTLYNPDVVYKASRNQVPLNPNAPLILGIDPARTGDRTVLAFRQGKVFREVITYPKMDDTRLTTIIAGYLKNGYKGTKVAKVFIDYAIGEGVRSFLHSLNFIREVTAVHFGESASEPERYQNKRIEMAMDLRDWFGDTGAFVSIPPNSSAPEGKVGKDNNIDDVVADLLAIPDFMQSDGPERIKLPPKDQIKKDFGRSPDIFDAMILTFAFPVHGEKPAALQEFVQENLSHLPPSEIGAILRDFDVA